jgi:hypothetical protein
MPSISFDDQRRYAFAALMGAPLGAVTDDASQSITAPQPLADLLARVAQGQPAVLPVREANHDTWLVTAAVRRDLEAAFVGFCRFALPTYAEHDGIAPLRQEFDPSTGELGALGAQLYGAGFYRFRSLPAHFNRILERVGLWAKLEAHRPPLRIVQTPAYRDLLDGFNTALSAAAWDEAAALLDEIRRRGLTSAENLAFLEVQWMAQQQRWAELWRRRDFADLARLRAPRAVREALLAAFHQGELLALEQGERWNEALEAFKRQRGRLGGLLEGSSQTSYGPALRVFAYRELVVANRHAFDLLAEQASDETTQQVFAALVSLFPASSLSPTPTVAPVQPAITPQQALHAAFDDEDYDRAWVAAEGMADVEKRTTAMLQTAFYSHNLVQAEAALLQLWSLPEERQQALQQRSRRFAQIIATLSQLIEPHPAQVAVEEPLLDWVAWLAAAVANPDDRRLPRALQFIATSDSPYWNDARVLEAAEHLVSLAADGATLQRAYLREAVRHLRNYFIQEPEFPREGATYDDLYEALYLATLEQNETNEQTTLALLRLAEARLRRAPQLRLTVAEHVRAWLSEPIPALEGAALETLDLLAAYGVPGSAFGQWYRNWAEAVLASPRELDQISLANWIALGEWVQPGEDLLLALRTRLERASTDEADPLAALPEGFAISIFTLRPQSAERIGQLLRERNPGVRIRICSDTVLTDQARGLAQHCDMAVVVTTCITHALTYGIGPYLNDPVYPQSSGSAGILRAIEARARRLAA